MNELQAVVAGAKAARRDEKPALLATVVRVHGLAYRRPGARMLLSSDGWLAGSISGGCLEADILRKAWWRTRDGERIRVIYDSTVLEGDVDDELSWGFGLGCNGVVEVLLERLISGQEDCPVDFIEACLRSRRPGVMATVIGADAENMAGRQVAVGQRLLQHSDTDLPDVCTIVDHALAMRIGQDVARLLWNGEGSRVVTYPLMGDARVDVFLEVVEPPRPLLICGAGHDAVPLTRMAKEMGWHVTVVDPRPGVPSRPDRFPGADAVISCAPCALSDQTPLDARTFAVVMSHNVVTDAALLAELLPSSVQYIGVLGPRKRTERLLSSLRQSGAALPGLDRLHAPVGLDIGADDPASIALSMLAEMQAFAAGRTGGFLRERDRPIHEPTGERRTTELFRPPIGAAARESVPCALMTNASV